MDRQARSGIANRTETLDISTVRRVACMLDLDPSAIGQGDALPVGWHFIAMPASTRRVDLRADGFPGLGVPMPDFGLPRLMLAGRSVSYCSDLVVGETVERISRVESIDDRSAAAKPMVLATIAHELRSVVSGEVAVVETQTYILLPAATYRHRAGEAAAPGMSRSRTVVPDATLLFQYSALGFNSHRIHLDRAYARDVEGFPDLVVNGGLATLLLTEFARLDLGVKLTSLTMRNAAPLFCDRPLTLAAAQCDGAWTLAIHNDHGEIAAHVEVETA